MPVITKLEATKAIADVVEKADAGDLAEFYAELFPARQCLLNSPQTN